MIAVRCVSISSIFNRHFDSWTLECSYLTSQTFKSVEVEIAVTQQARVPLYMILQWKYRFWKNISIVFRNWNQNFVQKNLVCEETERTDIDFSK